MTINEPIDLSAVPKRNGSQFSIFAFQGILQVACQYRDVTCIVDNHLWIELLAPDHCCAREIL